MLGPHPPQPVATTGPPQVPHPAAYLPLWPAHASIGVATNQAAAPRSAVANKRCVIWGILLTVQVGSDHASASSGTVVPVRVNRSAQSSGFASRGRPIGGRVADPTPAQAGGGGPNPQLERHIGGSRLLAARTTSGYDHRAPPERAPPPSSRGTPYATFIP